jgi:hypothetical protein
MSEKRYNLELNEDERMLLIMSVAQYPPASFPGGFAADANYTDKLRLLARLVTLDSGESSVSGRNSEQSSPAPGAARPNPELTHPQRPAAPSPEKEKEKKPPTLFGEQEGERVTLSLLKAEIPEGSRALRVSWKTGSAWRNATVWDPNLFEHVKARVLVPTAYWIVRVTKGEKTYYNIKGLEC